MPTTRPSPSAQPAAETTAVIDHGWKVVIFDDDVTPMEVVILGLQKAVGLSIEVAEMVMWEAHNSGSAVARSGLVAEDAERICERLHAMTRIEGLCPGVHCEAQQD